VQDGEAQDVHQRALRIRERKAPAAVSPFPVAGDGAGSTALAVPPVQNHAVAATGFLARLDTLVELFMLAADDDEHRASLLSKVSDRNYDNTTLAFPGCSP
jgi:hypothetical protein